MMNMQKKITLLCGAIVLAFVLLFPCRKWSAESPTIARAKGEFHPSRTFLYSNRIEIKRSIEIDVTRVALDIAVVLCLTGVAVLGLSLRENLQNKSDAGDGK